MKPLSGWRVSEEVNINQIRGRTNFLKIHLCPRCVQPNTDVLLAKKGGETDEHCEIFRFSGFGRCGAGRFCLR